MNRNFPKSIARVFFLMLFVVTAPLRCVADSEADRMRQLEDLTVVIRADDKVGTGIIFGGSSDRLYVFTANHNVRTGPTPADRVSVQVRWLPGERLKGMLLDNADMGLDIAVLTIPQTASTPILHYDVLGDPTIMQPGDEVYTLGHPNGNLWQTNVKPDAIANRKFGSIFFQSNFIGPGQSGGALLDKERRLIGMIIKDEPPHGEARGIDRILDWLEQFDYPLELSSPGTPGKLAQFEDEIREDVVYNCAALSVWPKADSNPGARQASLHNVLKRVESEPRFRNAKSTLVADLYRCTGGVELIVEGEMWDKLPRALPYLHRSIEANPNQPLLRQNVAYFEGFLQAHEGNIKEYITNCLQVLRGNDSNIQSIVDQMMEEIRSPEFQAKQWLMKDATANPPLQTWLETISIRIKRENNIDAPVEVTSSMLPNGLVEVRAKIGPNIFVWNVDYNKRKYFAMNKLTEDFMGLVEKPKSNPN